MQQATRFRVAFLFLREQDEQNNRFFYEERID